MWMEQRHRMWGVVKGSRKMLGGDEKKPQDVAALRVAYFAEGAASTAAGVGGHGEAIF
jgi:hypothetical protein